MASNTGLSSANSTSLQRLDPSVRTLWTVRYGIAALIFGGLLFFYELLHFFGTSALPLPFGVTSLLVLLVIAGGGAVAARLKYRYWRFELRSEELYLEHGVITRVHTIVPLRRIQHLDVSQNLLEREWELGRLVVYTAGTKQNSVILPGLPIERAREMRDIIKRYVLEHEE